MSFDIYLQAFDSGGAADRDGDVVRRLVLEHAVGEPKGGFVRISVDGDEADVYGVPDVGGTVRGLMFNHVSHRAFDVLVEVAQAADLVVMPVGVPVCVVSPDQERHLPDELAAGEVVLIASGRDLREVIDPS